MKIIITEHQKKLMKRINKYLKENAFYGIFNKPSAAADSVRVNDICLYYYDDGAYPFGWFYDWDNKTEEVYVGDESSMHSSPATKFLEDKVKNDIKANGLEADFDGIFVDYYGDELEFSNSDDDKQYLVDYVYYKIYDDEKYGKCCHVEVMFKNDETYEVDTEYDNVYDDLIHHLENEDIAWDIWNAIDLKRGIPRAGQMFYNVNETNNETFDPSEFLEATYKPTNNELQGALESMSDSGRFWKYDKIICFWGVIPNDELQSMLDELTEKTGIDFSDYRIVYEDEDTGEVKCDTISEYIQNGNETYVADTRENKGIHNLPAQEKWSNTSAWRKMGNKLNYQKLAYRDHEGNIRTDKEPMTLAQYHNIIRQESKDRLSRVISESIKKFLVKEGII